MGGSEKVQKCADVIKGWSLTKLFFFSEWMPPGNRVISVTGCNFTQIVCAAGPILFYLEIKDGKIVQNGDTTLEHEVACIDITPLNETDNKSEIVGVGLWTDITVRLLKLPSLEEITKESLGGDIIPRSILMAQVWSYF